MKKRVLEVRWNDYKNGYSSNGLENRFKRFYNLRNLLDWVENNNDKIVSMKIIRQKKEYYDCK
jgi:hypothetical protein